MSFWLEIGTDRTVDICVGESTSQTVHLGLVRPNACGVGGSMGLGSPRGVRKLAVRHNEEEDVEKEERQQPKGGFAKMRSATHLGGAP